MSDKSSRRFEKLKKRYESARRRAPEKGVAAVADILASGPSALMSPAGREAIDSELKAMKAERRALRKLQILAGEARSEESGEKSSEEPKPAQEAAPAPVKAASRAPRKAATKRAAPRKAAVKRAAPKRQPPGK
ncbi:MAG: hypothetical protein JNK46_17665 [Methylobacteriaceae bacterium]|nr:hypothetical protein [Methylobacteriaceae bacterium]